MDDDRLIAELGQAAEVADPLPGHLIEAAIAGFTLRTLDEELAELSFDSAAQDAGVLVRSEPASRLVRFRSGELVIELEIILTGASARLVGQLLPSRPARIEIRQAGSTLDAPADELGRFAATVPGPGPFQLRITAADMPRPMVTEWISA